MVFLTYVIAEKELRKTMSISNVNQQPSFTGAYVRLGMRWGNLKTSKMVSQRAVQRSLDRAGDKSLALYLGSFCPSVKKGHEGFEPVKNLSLPLILTGKDALRFKRLKGSERREFMNGIFSNLLSFNNLKTRKVDNPKTMFVI